MNTPPQVLIVGAGPTGLAAALFLTRAGVSVHLVDAATEPSPSSRALGVNPRTLTLLEPTGVTARIEAEAQPIHALDLHRHGKPLARIAPDWAALDPASASHPMTILPQARSEALLTQALAELGVHPERGRKAVGLIQTAELVTVAFEDGETIPAPLVFAADGSHSVIRHALNIGFPGDGWPEPWSLMDVDLTGPKADEGWIDLRRDGGFICLPYSGKTFRLFGFGAPLADCIPSDWTVGSIHWQSQFKISHRIAERLSLGRVALGGDAAHIHSPMGARGMNLGIEDACVFAACAVDFLAGQSHRIDDYNRLRHPVDAKVVKDVRFMTSLVRNTSPVADMLKGVIPPIAARLPFLINAGLKIGMGLDHPVALR